SKIPVFYHRTALKLMGVRVRLVGAPLRAPSTLYVGNHVSWLDIPVMGAQLPVSFIAKREVGDWGPFGTLARLQRTIFVDRERRPGDADGAACYRRLPGGERRAPEPGPQAPGGLVWRHGAGAAFPGASGPWPHRCGRDFPRTGQKQRFFLPEDPGGALSCPGP